MFYLFWSHKHRMKNTLFSEFQKKKKVLGLELGIKLIGRSKILVTCMNSFTKPSWRLISCCSKWTKLLWRVCMTWCMLHHVRVHANPKHFLQLVLWLNTVCVRRLMYFVYMVTSLVQHLNLKRNSLIQVHGVQPEIWPLAELLSGWNLRNWYQRLFMLGLKAHNSC